MFWLDNVLHFPIGKVRYCWPPLCERRPHSVSAM